MMAPGPCVHIVGIGVLGPGMAGWAAARTVLRTPGGWQPGPVVLPATRLSPSERRRAGETARLAIAVAEQAVDMAGLDPGTLATVFSSSGGDGANCHALCEALATADKAVSPTRFISSVHNAAAAAWHIAVASRAPSTSLSAHDASFGAGLLESITQCVANGRPVLFACADTPYPAVLHAVRPMASAFGVALLLAPGVGAGWSLALTAADGAAEGTAGEPAATACGDAALEALRTGVPAARCLPLLQALAQDGAGACSVELSVHARLGLRVGPATGASAL